MYVWHPQPAMGTTPPWFEYATLYPDTTTPTIGERFGEKVIAGSIQGSPVLATGASTYLGDQPGPALRQPTGAVFVYSLDKSSGLHGTWVLEARITAPSQGLNDRFGEGLALHNSVLVVGAPGRDSGLYSDAVCGNCGWSTIACLLGEAQKLGRKNLLCTRADGCVFTF